jgi:hypothetical protein
VSYVDAVIFVCSVRGLTKQCIDQISMSRLCQDTFMLGRTDFLRRAAALLVSGLVGLEARAGSVILPVSLDPGLVTTTSSSPSFVGTVSNGNTTTVTGDGVLTFSDFTYSSTARLTGTAYPATNVVVSQLLGVPNETGIVFNGRPAAPRFGTVDIATTYTVTAPVGELIDGAYLAASGSVAGTGFAFVGETIRDAATGRILATLAAGTPAFNAQEASWAGVQSITVKSDFLMIGGRRAGGSASISGVGEGFSIIVPEPTSIVLLGIGMTAGFFVYRSRQRARN